MNEPAWIAYDVVLAVHEAQIAEHGGLNGIRDRGLLESALARPRNLFYYDPSISSLNELAAAYAAAISRNHPFADGNKRTAWVVCQVFLRLNGDAGTYDQSEVLEMMLGLASSAITEQQFAAWLGQ